MTEDELMDLLCDSRTPLPCMMADGRMALLIINPTFHQEPPREFGFQVHGEEDIRWRTPEKIRHMGGGALAEVSQ